MEWSRLLSTKRERAGGNFAKAGDLRSEFEKDYHRIIGSASFRRLQDKTQVFPLDKSDFVRTRLTHSLEVSSLGKSLGQTIGENILEHRKNSGFTPQMKEDISHILECAGLIHDIGNPPFGHFGEIAIREWFERNLPKLTFCQKNVSEMFTAQMKQDFFHFEGNAQALRLVTRLHYLVDEHGMNLQYPPSYRQDHPPLPTYMSADAGFFPPLSLLSLYEIFPRPQNNIPSSGLLYFHCSHLSAKMIRGI